jgi:hypothetical protein
LRHQGPGLPLGGRVLAALQLAEENPRHAGMEDDELDVRRERGLEGGERRGDAFRCFVDARQELLGDPPDDVLPDLVLGPVVAEQRSLREAHPARDRRRRQLARVLLCGELDDRPDGDGPTQVGGKVSGRGGSCLLQKASNQLLA